MGGNLIETLIGVIVLIVAAVFLAFAYSWADGGAVRGYELTARFNRVNGVKVGSDVLVSGIKVGTVVGISLDPKTHAVELRFGIDDLTRLPEDSSAVISSGDLLGDKFIALVPGGAKEKLGAGDEIKNTTDSVDIGALLGEIVLIAVNAEKVEKKEPE
jgi:phospholipid/cholesterol/gamma-HCH transport system substrate-binding protein